MTEEQIVALEKEGWLSLIYKNNNGGFGWFFQLGSRTLAEVLEQNKLCDINFNGILINGKRRWIVERCELSLKPIGKKISGNENLDPGSHSEETCLAATPEKEKIFVPSLISPQIFLRPHLSP